MAELNDDERTLLLAFADNNMSIRRTAEALHYDRRTIVNMLEALNKRMGVDPHQFWTLHYLVSCLLGEELIVERKTSEVKDQVRAKADS